MASRLFFNSTGQRAGQMDAFQRRGFLPIILAVLLIAIGFLPAGCTGGLNVERYTNLQSTAKRFTVCHGYGCVFLSSASLTRHQWQELIVLFQPPATNAQWERRKIAEAIGLMEQFVGDATGTSSDEGRTSFIFPTPGQMDCIDETVNTSLYLHFLEDAGFLVWHEVADPVRRGYLLDGNWPHNSAVVKEKESGRGFAVDSWFFDNGREPSIVPVEEWLAGWRP